MNKYFHTQWLCYQNTISLFDKHGFNGCDINYENCVKHAVSLYIQSNNCPLKVCAHNFLRNIIASELEDSGVQCILAANSKSIYTHANYHEIRKLVVTTVCSTIEEYYQSFIRNVHNFVDFNLLSLCFMLTFLCEQINFYYQKELGAFLLNSFSKLWLPLFEISRYVLENLITLNRQNSNTKYNVINNCHVFIHVLVVFWEKVVRLQMKWKEADIDDEIDYCFNDLMEKIFDLLDLCLIDLPNRVFTPNNEGDRYDKHFLSFSTSASINFDSKECTSIMSPITLTSCLHLMQKLVKILYPIDLFCLNNQTRTFSYFAIDYQRSRLVRLVYCLFDNTTMDLTQSINKTAHKRRLGVLLSFLMHVCHQSHMKTDIENVATISLLCPNYNLPLRQVILVAIGIAFQLITNLDKIESVYESSSLEQMLHIMSVIRFACCRLPARQIENSHPTSSGRLPSYCLTISASGSEVQTDCQRRLDLKMIRQENVDQSKFARGFVKRMMDDDTALVRSLLLLVKISEYIDKLMQGESQVLQRMHLVVANPHWLFAEFLSQAVGYSEFLVLDWLVSPETPILAYLLFYMRCLIRDIQLLSKANASPLVGDMNKQLENIITTLDKNSIIDRAIVLIQDSEKTSINWPVEQIGEFFGRLAESLERLETRNSMPYSAGGLVRRLKSSQTHLQLLLSPNDNA